MESIYIALREDQSFHTIIIKKEIADYTYLVAIGYAGGGVYEEFYAKLMYDEEGNISGKFSRAIGSGEWETILTKLKFNKDDEWFDAETEDLYELMEREEDETQYKLINELRKYIYLGYDEETDLEYEHPEAKSIDTSIFKEFENNPGEFYNNEWDDDWLHITNSNIWGLSTRFPHVIDYYL